MSTQRATGVASRAFGKAVRDVRKERGMTQREVAARASMPVSSYNRVENAASAIDLEQMTTIARALNTTLLSLLEHAAREHYEGSDAVDVLPGRRRPRLSNREVEVLRAYLAGDKRSASRSLFISEATVSTHLSKIRSKYRAVDRQVVSKSQLLARAIEDGLLATEEV